MDGYTLIIPTYQRPVMLRATLTHLAESGLDIRVLVLDSSTEPAASANRAAMREFPLAERREFDPSTRFAHKLMSGLQEVETPLVSLCADDDLLFPATVQRCVERMHEHPGLVAAHGVYLNFAVEETPPHTLRVECEYDGLSLDLPQPGARLMLLLNRYEALYYAVFRTPVMRALFEAQTKIESLHYQELFQATGTVLAGAVWRSPDIYIARRSDPRGEVHREKCEPVWWICEEDYVDFFRHYMAYRGQLLEWWRGREPGLEPAKMERLCDAAHYLYLRRALLPDFMFPLAANTLGVDRKIFARDTTGLLEGALRALGEKHPPVAGDVWTCTARRAARDLAHWVKQREQAQDSRIEYAGEDRPVQLGRSLPNARHHPGVMAALATLRAQVKREWDLARPSSGTITPPSS